MTILIYFQFIPLFNDNSYFSLLLLRYHHPHPYGKSEFFSTNPHPFPSIFKNLIGSKLAYVYENSS